MKFADIPGHEDVKQRLRDMADSGRLPHAILLEGPAGSGKFALLLSISIVHPGTMATVAVCVRHACSTRRSTISTPHSRFPW